MSGGRDGRYEKYRDHNAPNTSVFNNTLLGELTLDIAMVFPKVANSQELHVSQKDIEPNTFEKRLDKIFDLLDIQLGNPLLLHRLWYGIPFVGGFRNFVLSKVKQVIDDAVKEVYDNAP